MKLYVSLTSPYARMARIVVREKGLEDRVEEIVARTREAGSPYYEVNPSGRIPYLSLQNGTRLEGSTLVCAYLDELDGATDFGRPDGEERWSFLALEEQARSLLDGLAVWVRELKRPPDERSPTTLAHEQARADRLTTEWAGIVQHPILQGPLNMVQITLACALEMDRRLPKFRWRADHPELAAWLDRVKNRPSFVGTMPPS